MKENFRTEEIRRCEKTIQRNSEGIIRFNLKLPKTKKDSSVNPENGFEL